MEVLFCSAIKKLERFEKICPNGVFKLGQLAQLVRASALHAGCRRFESCIAHHLAKRRTALNRTVRFFVF